MATWIVVGAIGLGIVVLAGSVVALMGHLRELGLAVRRTRLRAEQAQGLQVKTEALTERLAALSEQVAIFASEDPPAAAGASSLGRGPAGAS